MANKVIPPMTNSANEINTDIRLQTSITTEVPLPSGILDNYCQSEEASVSALLNTSELNKSLSDKISTEAMQLTLAAKASVNGRFSIEDFLKEYGLDNHEGIALMCLAEALIRIPDQKTADAFISERIGTADWHKHLGNSESFLVNASTWGLNLSGKWFKPSEEDQGFKSIADDVDKAQYGFTLLASVFKKLGAPLAKKSIRHAMILLGKRFVAGRTIDEALTHSIMEREQGYCHSYDMLGEAAVTESDAQNYLASYLEALTVIHQQEPNAKAACGLSVKLSALHPRFEPTKASAIEELYTRTHTLLEEAVKLDIPITIDAEECVRLEVSTQIFTRLFLDPVCSHWPKLGLAIQAYQKRAPHLIDYLQGLAQQENKIIPVRLVKGAYWDNEIKWAQQAGLRDYPVFTRKAHTDICYLVCAEKLLRQPQCFYPQFASHNAHTVVSIRHYAQALNNSDYEFQRLHGMGESLYRELLLSEPQCKVRIYAPVGQHKQLLPYLVRRLIENSANSSFVYALNDPDLAIEELVKDPFTLATVQQSAIPIPLHIYDDDRENSTGIPLGSNKEIKQIYLDMADFLLRDYQYPSGILTKRKHVRNPANRADIVGSIYFDNSDSIEIILRTAHNYFPQWRSCPAHQRAKYLQRFADILEENKCELYALLLREAGKTFENAVAEVREAIDFCRYYALECLRLFQEHRTLKGTTGEINELSLEGRGVFFCISPWNFPLALFVGQVSAALAAGNCVVAKPAPSTPLIAKRTTELFYQAGIPCEALQFLLCKDSYASSLICSDPRIDGVAFTGSIHTARKINQQLAARDGAIVPLIAETGGQNAMIVDSTVLLEQACLDIISSAFDSAGQRCSALRVLYLQEEIADDMIELLRGRMALLKLGPGENLDTDVGPVINAHRQSALLKHLEFLDAHGDLLAQAPFPANQDNAYYVPPSLYEISSLSFLTDEVFGPILHVIRYRSEELEDVLTEIKRTDYGLTLGIHSRMENKARLLAQHMPIGNIYINRNMIGATVGVQPFGGQGASGTGPKAGGPNYLRSFSIEKHILSLIHISEPTRPY